MALRGIHGIDGLQGLFPSDDGPSAPVNTVAPVISGDAEYGATLTVTSDGTWTPGTGLTFTYQWLRDGVEIAGATASTRVLDGDDIGADMSCEVTATGDNGSTAAVSNEIGPVVDPIADILATRFDLLDGSAFARNYSRASAARNAWTGALESSGVLRERTVALTGSLATIRQCHIEGSRTNLWQRSQEFDNAYWSVFQASVTADDLAAPDGTTTADKLECSAGGTAAAQGAYKQSITVTSGVAYTWSVYARSDEYDGLQIIMEGSTASLTGVNFDLTNGTVIGAGSSVVTSGIEDIGGGWHRCWGQLTTAGTSADVRFYIAPAAQLNADGTMTAFERTIGSGIHIWGAQLERGDCVSSYIHTTTATVTRAADSYRADVSGLPGGGIAVATGELFCAAALYQNTGRAGGFQMMVMSNVNSNVTLVCRNPTATALLVSRGNSASGNTASSTRTWQSNVQKHYGVSWVDNVRVSAYEAGVEVAAKTTAFNAIDLDTDLKIGWGPANTELFGVTSAIYSATPYSSGDRDALVAAIPSDPEFVI